MHPPPFSLWRDRQRIDASTKKEDDSTADERRSKNLNPSAWDDEKEGKNGNRELRTRIREPFRSSVRELRQRRAYYRCCIPALAGFVSHRSIAPDGFTTSRRDNDPEQRLFSEQPARDRVPARPDLLHRPFTR